MDKVLKLPSLLLILDNRDSLGVVLTNHFKVDRNQFIFEAFVYEN